MRRSSTRLTVFESDLGEYIVQLRHEKPYTGFFRDASHAR